MEKLKSILIEVYDSSKAGKKFLKKYNLSMLDIHMLELIVAGKCNCCFYFNLLPVLDHYKIKYDIDDINFYIVGE